MGLEMLKTSASLCVLPRGRFGALTVDSVRILEGIGSIVPFVPLHQFGCFEGTEAFEVEGFCGGAISPPLSNVLHPFLLRIRNRSIARTVSTPNIIFHRPESPPDLEERISPITARFPIAVNAHRVLSATTGLVFRVDAYT